MASLRCPECGATLKTKTEIPPGKSIKCPKCGKSFVVPAQSEASQPIIPTKPRKKSNTGLLLGLVGGVLALCCCCTAVPSAGWFFRDKLGFSELIAKDGKKDAKPATDGKKDKTEDPGKPADGKVETLNLAEFAREWKADRQKTNARYKGKMIEVSGPIRKFTIDLERKPVVLIETDTAENAILVNVATKAKEPWALADDKQTVTLRGKFKDFELVPYLQDAEFVTPPEKKMPLIKAVDLAAEAAKDEFAFKEKYKNKSVIIVGEVLKLDRDDSLVLLKGFDARPIQFYTYDVPRPALGSLLKVGQEARLYSRFSRFLDPVFNEHKAVVSFTDAMPITGAK